MSLVELFNGYVTKTINSKAFHMYNVYVPIGTHTFANQLESACTNYPTIAYMSHKYCKKSASNAVDDN